MFPIETPGDRQATEKLQWRRNREDERKGRILKSQHGGVENGGPDNQVKEVKRSEDAEKETLKALAADLVSSDQVACLLDGRQVQERRALQRALVDSRQCHQPLMLPPLLGRRKFDLGDPGRLGAADGGDGQMTLPGLLGEDPGSRARVKRQQEQLREWSQQQQRERNAAKLCQKQEKEQFDQSRISMDHRALQLELAKQTRKKASALATKEYNLALAAETRQRRLQEQEQDEECNRSEILHHQHGSAFSTDTPERVDIQEVKQIMQFNHYQLEERRRKELEQQQEDEQQHCFCVASARSALLQERQQARLSRRRRQELDATNGRLAQAHQQQKKSLEAEPISGFFSRFSIRHH